MLVLLISAAAAPELPLVTLHPFTHNYYVCAEHPDGEMSQLGDAATDNSGLMSS